MIVGLDDYVLLREEDHKYFDKDGREYMSVSKFIEMFKCKKDWDMIAHYAAKKRGMKKQELLDEWNKSKDYAINHGNRVHNALERFGKTTTILPEDENLRPLLLGVSRLHMPYFRRVNEAILYNSDFLVAGTTDLIMQVTSHKDSCVDFEDYKTNVNKGIQFFSEYDDYMSGPLSHLQDCNYNHYALQLSIYAYLYQLKSGKNIRMLNILYIPYDDLLQYRRIPVPYLKREVETMFEYKMQMNSLLIQG